MDANSLDSTYAELLEEVKAEIAQGLSRAQAAYDKEKIITYWRVGESISKHLLQNKFRADYGKQLYKRLSEDLGIGERLLYQISQFYNTYPKLEPAKNLKWSHYRLLASIKDKTKRSTLEERASKDCLSKRSLEAFIKEDAEPVAQHIQRKVVKNKKLSIPKGKLYTYKIFKADYANNMLIDCGYNIFHESSISSFAGNHIETTKTETGFSFAETKAKKMNLYTYKAYVSKIVDGDTLWLNIDCGFRLWVKQKVRLRGIDTPSIETAKGQEALAFVQRELKDIKFVIIKSHGRDKFGRYLTAIFYSKNSHDPAEVLAKGSFLNQKLVDNSLASIV